MNPLKNHVGRLATLLLLAFTVIDTQAQETDDLYAKPIEPVSYKPLAVSQSLESIGRNTSTDMEIIAKVFELPEHIKEVHLDSINGYLLFQLRGTNNNGTYWNSTGSMVQYDVPHQKSLWSRNINYSNSYLFQIQSLLLLNKANSSECLDPQTGHVLWEKKAQIVLTDSASQIGVGIRENTEFANTTCVYGIDLRSGKELWKRYVPFEQGKKPIVSIDDSTIMLISSGLHELNIKTGEGWSYGHSWSTPSEATQPSHLRDLKRFPSQTFYVSTTAVQNWGLRSNLMQDSLGFFFVHKATVVRLSNKGELLWSNQLNELEASKTEIWLDSTYLYVLNNGIRYLNYYQVAGGKPFFAKFKRSDGEMMFNIRLPRNRGPLIDYWLTDSIMYALFSDRVQAYSYKTGIFINELVFKNKEKDKLRYFVSKSLWTKDDRLCKTLWQSDSLHLIVYTTKEKFFKIDPQLQSFTPFNDSLYQTNLLHEDFKVVVRNGTSYLVDEDGKLFGSLQLSSKAVFYNNLIIDIRGNHFYVIDMEALKKKKPGSSAIK